MNRYRTTSVVKLPEGRLVALSDDQARRRAHAIEATDRAGIYVARQRLQFKAGEEIGLEDADKGMAVDEVKPEKPARKGKGASNAGHDDADA